MRTAIPILAALTVGAVIDAIPVEAQQAPNDRVRRVIVYGNDPCPRGQGDDVIICARRPDRDRYRIPEQLRQPPDDPENESWATRAEALEYVGRGGIQSCSTVGPGGFTGCWEQMVRRSQEDRRANPENAPTPR